MPTAIGRIRISWKLANELVYRCGHVPLPAMRGSLSSGITENLIDVMEDPDPELSSYDRMKYADHFFTEAIGKLRGEKLLFWYPNQTACPGYGVPRAGGPVEA